MSDDESASIVVERLPPAEAFGLLSHEMRLGMVEALSEAAEPLSFSELREAVGVRDTGQFNYHLGKLVGVLIRDTEEGYELTIAGERVVGGVLSGRYTQVLDADPVPVDADCLNCGAAMAARFEDGLVRIGCDECEFNFTELRVPAGALANRDPEAVPDVAAKWLKRLRQTIMSGFCPMCDGHLDNRVRLPSDDEAPEWLEYDSVLLHHDCTRCSYGGYSSIPAMVVPHPAVVAFHWDHGIDLRETPDWDLDWLTLGTASVESESPLRIAVPIDLDGERREFVFDEGLTLVEERT